MGIPTVEQFISPEMMAAHLRRLAGRVGVEEGNAHPPEDHQVLVGQMRLHYLDWGEPASRSSPIVFCHGGGLNAHSWDAVCLQLRESHHCFAVDMRGHGDSEWSPNLAYSFEDMADDVGGFIDILGLEPALMVGMSMGGLAAIELAGRRSSRLTGLVLVDVGPELQRAGTERIRKFMRNIDPGTSIDDLVDRALQFNPRRDPEMLRLSLRMNLRDAPGGGVAWKYDSRHMGASSPEVYEARAARLSARLSEISCPTLVVRGGESDTFSEENARRVVDRLPAGRLVTVPRAGHSVQGDDPVALVRAIADFLPETRMERRDHPDKRQNMRDR
jgi:esterase